MMPAYVVRQLLLTVLMAAAYFAHLPMDAVTAMIAAGLSIWLPMLGQLVAAEPQAQDPRSSPAPRRTNSRSGSPTALPILLVEGFYALLTYTDILVLQQFRPPDEVAVYYAAAKTLALVAFIHYSIAATTAHRFSSFTSPATAKGSPPSWRSRSSGRSGLRSPRPCCCSRSAGRSSACSAPSSPAAIT